MVSGADTEHSARGLLAGIVLDDSFPFATSQGHFIENIWADQNTHRGLLVFGRGNIIQNNQVVGTGRTTVDPNVDDDGIHVPGPGACVLDNDIINVTPTGSTAAFGIFVSLAPGAMVEHNRLSTWQSGITHINSTGKYRDNLTSAWLFLPGGTDAGNNT